MQQSFSDGCSLSALLSASKGNLRPITLIASLPRNDPDLAQAALDAGADVLKVHVNLHHHASQTHFGSLEDERPALERILRIWEGRICGIVPGADPNLDPGTLVRLYEMGFGFFSLYLHHAPVGLLPPPEKIERMLALAYSDGPLIIEGIKKLPVQVVELSMLDPDTYGQPLTYHDLAQYAVISRAVYQPTVVPTQHNIPPTAIPELLDAGVSGLMLGVIAAGNTADSWFQAVNKYRRAAEQCFR
jgi:hypothetical protein